MLQAEQQHPHPDSVDLLWAVTLACQLERDQ